MSAIEEVAFSSAVLCTKPSDKWMCQVLHGLFRLDSGRFRAEHVAMLDSMRRSRCFNVVSRWAMMKAVRPVKPVKSKMPQHPSVENEVAILGGCHQTSPIFTCTARARPAATRLPGGRQNTANRTLFSRRQTSPIVATPTSPGLSRSGDMGGLHPSDTTT